MGGGGGSVPDVISAAISDVLSPTVLLTIVLAAAYGIFVGSIPGLTATMAVALMVPLTFFLSDVEAVAAIVTTVTCSIFAGDIPATLMRIPGTPASAAYAADAYALTQQGRHAESLSVSLVFSVLGGLFGTLVLAMAAPQLARFAAQFTYYEYFWLFVLGLTCAAIVSDESRLKGALSLLLGLLLSCVGLGTDYSVPRLTLGFDQLITGINFIPAMIGLFGVSEVLRNALRMNRDSVSRGSGDDESRADQDGSQRRSFVSLKSAMASMPPLVWRRKLPLLRGSGIGSVVGMLPGAGADIAAWISYAVSKRFSKQPREYGKGSLEGIGDATSANNAALGSAWIPALVFGIPGDSVTAIAIGVLLMKNITPGPDIFDPAVDPSQATLVFSVFVTFVVANLVLIPIGMLAIGAGGLLIRVPRRVLLPVILLFCIIGSYAMNASYFDVWVMLAMGVLGFVLERLGVPLAPIVLGLILGGPVEHRFIQCITNDASVGAFVGSPIAKILALACLALWLAPALAAAVRSRRAKP